MGQVSKSVTWSTHGGLRWSEEGENKEENPHYKGDDQRICRKRIVHSRIVISFKSKRNIWKQPSLDFAEEDFPCTKLFIYTFEQNLAYRDCCPTHWSLVSRPLSTNSLFWALWAFVHFTWALGSKMCSYNYYLKNI